MSYFHVHVPVVCITVAERAANRQQISRILSAESAIACMSVASLCDDTKGRDILLALLTG